MPWRQPRAGHGEMRLPSAELDIHVVRRRERVATETIEEGETRLSRRFAPYMYTL